MRSAILWCALTVLAAPARAQETSQCVDCHRRETPAVVEQFLAGPHARAVVGCVGCHGGDAHASEREQGHAAAAGYAGSIPHVAVPAMCGKCHGQELGAVARSPHAAALRYTGAPSCTHCHESHRSAVPVAIQAKCAECHSEGGDPGLAVADEMAALLAGANEQIAELDRAIAAVDGDGAEIKRRMLQVERERVLELHRHVRQVSHTLHLEMLGPSVQRLAESVRTASAVAQADLEANGFSRQAVVLIFAAIALGLLLLSAVLAVLVFRLLRRVRRNARTPREARA